jgi:hypothetical protein
MAKFGKFSDKEMQKLVKKLKRVKKREFFENGTKELAKRMHIRVVRRTPVGQYPAGSGKTGGTLRRGWTVTPLSHKWHTYSISVINPVEYAPYVEYGHRTADHTGWVEGQFMMTISAKQTEDAAPKVLGKMLDKMMGSALK